MGTVLVLLVVGAVLLASRDLWAVQARAAGGMLEVAGVPHEVITDPDRLAGIEVGSQSRDGNVRTAHAPLIRLAPVDEAEPSTAQALGWILFGIAAVGALALSPGVPGPVKGMVLLGAAVVAGSLAYAAWWSPLPPLEVSGLLVDWRTSALAPICGIALVFAYDLYPLPGSFLVKTFWVVIAIVAIAMFSTVRMALVAAGYAQFGGSSFLALHQFAGMFWDLAPGMAVLAAGHATLALGLRGPRRFRFLP